jgi:hypothetical protein
MDHLSLDDLMVLQAASSKAALFAAPRVSDASLHQILASHSGTQLYWQPAVP